VIGEWSRARVRRFHYSRITSYSPLWAAWLAESKLAQRRRKVDKVSLRQGYGTTDFALNFGASENWRQGDYSR
jgi:hypothetical protein